MLSETSYRKNVWKQVRKNIPACIALTYIGILCFFAVFAYQFAPDNTPNANTQTIEIQAKEPGYSQLFIKIPTPINTERSFFSSLFSGKESGFGYIPVTDYRIDASSVWIKQYVDDETGIERTLDFKTLGLSSITNPNQILEKKTYWLGTDAFGRDVLSRLLVGSRVSLSVGLMALLVSLTLGIFLGALAGYYRGWIDDIIMWLVNVTWSMPAILLAFAFTLLLGKGYLQVFLAVGFTLWVSVARLVRGQVFSFREREFVQAARVLGFSDSRILFKHILPNIVGPLLVIAAGNFATAIMVEAGLSFLGIGVQPPTPSWGLMIKEHYHFILTQHPMLALIPGIAIMLLVLAFNVLGNALRDATALEQRTS